MATDTEATRGPGAPPTKAPKARAGGRTPVSHRTVTIGETILGGTPPLGHCTDSRPTHAGLSEKEAYLPGFLRKRLICLRRGAHRGLSGMGVARAPSQPLSSLGRACFLQKGVYTHLWCPDSGSCCQRTCLHARLWCPAVGFWVPQDRNQRRKSS